MPQIAEHRIFVVGALSGSDGLRDPKINLIFHTRASYGAETGKMVEQLTSTGVKSIAVVYQDDPFGKAGLKSAQGAFAKFNIKRPSASSTWQLMRLLTTAEIAKTHPVPSS
jgi:ABC-type branched-subunit amino acid transport system substrate-binding protein